MFEKIEVGKNSLINGIDDEAEKEYIDTSLSKETLLNIANAYGDSVYISYPVYEPKWGIVSEQLLALNESDERIRISEIFYE